MSVPSVSVSGNVRLWTVEDGVHPMRAPEYQTIARLGDPSWGFGEKTRVEVPDPSGYNKFVEAATVPGAVSRPTYSIMGRYPFALSDMLRLARKQCRLDVFALVGECRDPQNFSEGYEKILFFPNGQITTWSGENFGALGSDENSPANETLELSAREIYEFGRLAFTRLASTLTTRETLTVAVCDKEGCGDCGDASDGCQKIFVTMKGASATPGTKPTLLYSQDGGSTWTSKTIDTMFSNEVPSDDACIGANYVIAGNIPNSLTYINVDDLFAGTGAWVEVITGFVAGGNPNAMFSVDARHTWVVGDGGYVYFTANPTMGVEVQSAGTVTIQNLNDVDAFNTNTVLAVGQNNAVIYSTDGGESWGSVVGPAVGIHLNACEMWGEETWMVGTNDGRLFVTENQGQTWTEKEIPGNITNIYDIEFVDEAEGYMAVEDNGSGYIYRTLTGGYEWTALPDGKKAAIPGNDRINQLATCGVGKNRVFGVGLDDDGTAGIIVKASA